MEILIILFICNIHLDV